MGDSYGISTVTSPDDLAPVRRLEVLASIQLRLGKDHAHKSPNEGHQARRGLHMKKLALASAVSAWAQDRSRSTGICVSKSTRLEQAKTFRHWELLRLSRLKRESEYGIMISPVRYHVLV